MAGAGPVAGLEPRRAAAAMLTAVLDQGRTLDEAAAAHAALSPPDRARAQRLAATVLRQLARADAALAPHLRRAPPLAVRNVLRLAVVEMADGAAAHGAVNAAVQAVRGLPRGESFAGLVNAVLRKVGAAPLDLSAMPAPRLPGWLREKFVQAWGKPAVARIESVHTQEPPLDLALRPGANIDLPGAVLLPTGSLRLTQPGQVSALPGYAEGAWWVQDAAAALAAPVLAPLPGEQVIDLCAAPGGKTLQLAAAGARVTAVDASGARLARLHENLARTGLAATVVTADAREWLPPEPVDAVLLDAPCSATGTIRRHPDLPFVRSAADLPALEALQAALIDRALAMLRPGGRLVFCTCSLLPSEGEDQIAAALTRHPGLTADTPLPPGADPAWAARGGLRTRPDHWADRGGIDGFFIARLVKPA